MTVGSPMKLILGFSIPLLFGSLFQQFYSVVDTLIVGRFLGMKALAGVGATGSVNFLIVGFCMGICNGFAIPVAHKFGAKDYSGMRQIVANCVWLSVAFAVVITTVVSLLCRQILTWMNTPEDIFEMSKMIEKYRILFAELLDNLRELYLTILPEYGRLTMW